MLERAGLGRFQDADTAFLDAAALRAAAEPRATAADWATRWDAMVAQARSQGLAVRRRREPPGARGERRRRLTASTARVLDRGRPRVMDPVGNQSGSGHCGDSNGQARMSRCV